MVSLPAFLEWRKKVIEPIQQDIQVRFRYTVHFGTDIFSPGNPLIKDILSSGCVDLPKKLLVVIDRGVHHHHPHLTGGIESYCRKHREYLTLTESPLLVRGGEGVKNDPTYVTRLHKHIHDAGLCRHSYVMAIGGGAVLDMVGYASATAHRGVRLIRVPTTVLAQADSAAGVKNGINTFGKKNFVGTFAPPYAVLNDSRFLTTLPHRDWISGTAEAVKVALIKDASFFDFIEGHAETLAARNMAIMQQVIYRCVQLHLHHIATSGDPFEFGTSRPLDFGHWSAHKLEQLTGYGLRHGEGVAIGIALDTTYSYLAGFFSRTDWERVLATLSTIGFVPFIPELDDHNSLIDGLQEFREHLGGRLTVMLLSGIGKGLEVHEIDPRIVVASIALLRERTSSLEEAPRTSQAF
jgi:3-dehydroquinate synthase